jgi:hypothetical protein
MGEKPKLFGDVSISRMTARVSILHFETAQPVKEDILWVTCPLITLKKIRAGV